MADEVEAYFHVNEQFAKLGWAPILRLPHYIYPKLVREFYANVVDKEKYSGDFLESYVRGRRLVVTRGVIAQILRCRDDGSNVKLRKGFYWPGTWNRAQAADRFHVRFRATRRSQKMALFASDFEPQHHLLLYLFAHNIIPKKSGMNELRNSDLYFLDAMINGRGLEFNSLSLPSIIISYMRTVARSKAHSKAGKTCFGFPRLLTLLFESEGVNTERERRVQLEATNVVSITVLRQIRMPAAVIAEIQRGRPIAPSTSTHQGASTSAQGVVAVSTLGGQHVAAPSTSAPSLPPRLVPSDICL